jgi:hypothetical protein
MAITPSIAIALDEAFKRALKIGGFNPNAMDFSIADILSAQESEGPGADFGTAAPTSGTFTRGWKRWNSAPVAGGSLGWVCVTAGSPGTWCEFGLISDI